MKRIEPQRAQRTQRIRAWFFVDLFATRDLVSIFAFFVSFVVETLPVERPAFGRGEEDLTTKSPENTKSQSLVLRFFCVGSPQKI
ncbi:MAG: hypothetical protein CFE26_12575 [Verrucomicrobiales bacterium VVV1]|nr:MAG: hypothetical protein CFE26_12575 [Verrucomicrobiales bacterium VVV1]